MGYPANLGGGVFRRGDVYRAAVRDEYDQRHDYYFGSPEDNRQWSDAFRQGAITLEDHRQARQQGMSYNTYMHYKYGKWDWKGKQVSSVHFDEVADYYEGEQARAAEKSELRPLAWLDEQIRKVTRHGEGPAF
jgi:hypothetical protein